MADQKAPDTEFVDLGFDQAEAELARPVIKANAIRATIIATQVKRKDDDPENPNLVVIFETITELEATDGKKIPAGFRITSNIPMTDRGNMSEGSARNRLGKLHFAATGEKEGRPNTQAWQNKEVILRLKIVEEDAAQGYPAKNDITAIQPAAK